MSEVAEESKPTLHGTKWWNINGFWLVVGQVSTYGNSKTKLRKSTFKGVLDFDLYLHLGAWTLGSGVIVNTKPPRLLWSKYEYFLIRSCWDIHHLRNFDAKLWRKFYECNGSMNEQTNIRTERWKLYTSWHKCRGYNKTNSYPLFIRATSTLILSRCLGFVSHTPWCCGLSISTRGLSISSCRLSISSSRLSISSRSWGGRSLSWVTGGTARLWRLSRLWGTTGVATWSIVATCRWLTGIAWDSRWLTGVTWGSWWLAISPSRWGCRITWGSPIWHILLKVKIEFEQLHTKTYTRAGV